MFGPYTLLIPQNISELRDKLGGMMLLSPTFQDITGYFPGRNIENTFYELNEALRLLRGRLGEELYLKLREMSDQMRAHFEADPDKKNGGTLKGREIIMEMEDLLKQHARTRRSRS